MGVEGTRGVELQHRKAPSPKHEPQTEWYIQTQSPWNPFSLFQLLFSCPQNMPDITKSVCASLFQSLFLSSFTLAPHLQEHSSMISMHDGTYYFPHDKLWFITWLLWYFINRERWVSTLFLKSSRHPCFSSVSWRDKWEQPMRAICSPRKQAAVSHLEKWTCGSAGGGERKKKHL